MILLASKASRVKAGYNKIASEYAATRKDDSEDVRLLRQLAERLPKNATVLDAGCGSGYPVTRFLDKYFHVTGIDFFSETASVGETEGSTG